MNNPIGFMKTLLVTMVVALISAPAFSQTQSNTHEQVVPVTGLMVPTDLEQDSAAFVYASGMFPNGCYHLTGPRVNHLANRVHEIEMVATVNEGFCTMSLIPFMQKVDLGRLERGDHLLRVLNGDGTYFEKELTMR